MCGACTWMELITGCDTLSFISSIFLCVVWFWEWDEESWFNKNGSEGKWVKYSLYSTIFKQTLRHVLMWFSLYYVHVWSMFEWKQVCSQCVVYLTQRTACFISHKWKRVFSSSFLQKVSTVHLMDVILLSNTSTLSRTISVQSWSNSVDIKMWDSA